MQKRSCRFCFAPVLVYYSLLENNRLGVLESLTAIKITEGDSFSKYCCTKCWLNIKLAYQIQQNILDADRKLRSNIEAVHIKEESPIDEIIFDKDSNDSSDKSLATLKSEIIGHRAFESFQNICPICSERANIMANHLKKHFFKRSCDECSINFNDMLSYRNHCNLFHNDMSGKILVCKTCNLSFLYNSFYNFHIKNAHTNSNVIVNNNNNGRLKKKQVKTIKKAARRGSSVTKMRKIYPSGNFTSDLSSKKPHVKRCMKRISKNVSTGSDIDSSISKSLLECQQQLNTPSGTDVLNYDGEGNIKCPECPKVYHTKRQYSAHKAAHVKRTCPVCKLEITAINMSRHIEMHSARSVVCHICGAVAKNIGSLRGHLYYTHSTRQYSCEHCGKTFKKQYIRDLHIKKIHTGEKEHVCDTCGKSFFTLHCLTKHIKMTHLKLRPFICSYCEKGFCSKHALRTHIRQHTNEAPYICSICGEGFRQNVSLKAHKRSKHKIVEKKEFACNICHKMFVDAWAVKSHMRLHL